jgi:hypothetical protein
VVCEEAVEEDGEEKESVTGMLFFFFFLGVCCTVLSTLLLYIIKRISALSVHYSLTLRFPISCCCCGGNCGGCMYRDTCVCTGHTGRGECGRWLAMQRREDEWNALGVVVGVHV